MSMAASRGLSQERGGPTARPDEDIDGGKVIESRCDMGNTCGRREEDGEGGGGAGYMSYLTEEMS
jgi:hypothetical protein